MFIQTRGPLAACLLNDYVLKKLFVENLGAPWSSGAWGPNGPVVDPPLYFKVDGDGKIAIKRGLTIAEKAGLDATSSCKSKLRTCYNAIHKTYGCCVTARYIGRTLVVSHTGIRGRVYTGSRAKSQVDTRVTGYSPRSSSVEIPAKW